MDYRERLSSVAEIAAADAAAVDEDARFPQPAAGVRRGGVLLPPAHRAAFRDARAGHVMAPTADALYDFYGRALCGLDLF